MEFYWRLQFRLELLQMFTSVQHQNRNRFYHGISNIGIDILALKREVHWIHSVLTERSKQ